MWARSLQTRGLAWAAALGVVVASYGVRAEEAAPPEEDAFRLTCTGKVFIHPQKGRDGLKPVSLIVDTAKTDDGKSFEEVRSRYILLSGPKVGEAEKFAYHNVNLVGTYRRSTQSIEVESATLYTRPGKQKPAASPTPAPEPPAATEDAAPKPSPAPAPEPAKEKDADKPAE